MADLGAFLKGVISRAETYAKGAVFFTLNKLGPKRFECPICGWTGFTFLTAKRKIGPQMKKCPSCGSKERHRHQFLAFHDWKVAQLIGNARVLHIAPERRLLKLFTSADLYVRTDIDRSNPQMTIDVCTDITRSCFRPETFDFLYASHVLEHIENVDDAISEIHRLLVPGGCAFLDVPTYGGITQKLTERDHDGHLWHPGLNDWFGKYERAGFEVDYYPSDKIDPKYGVGVRSPITICKKGQ